VAGKIATLQLGILGICSSRRTRTQNAGSFGLLLLIFVENHSINHHAISCANIVNPDWSADFHSRPYAIFIEHLTASRHVSDCLTKTVCPRSAAFLEHDYVPRSVLGDRSAALGSGRCCSLRGG
jgi:hypothetical protein